MEGYIIQTFIIRRTRENRSVFASRVFDIANCHLSEALEINDFRGIAKRTIQRKVYGRNIA